MLSLLAGHITNRLWLSDATICTAVGAAIGLALAWIFGDFAYSGDDLALLREVSRVTLGIAVMGVALRLPCDWIESRWRNLAMVLGLGMPLMWLTGSTLALLLLPIGIFPALLLGAIVAPTDPVVSYAILEGKTAEDSVRAELRDMVAAESGANDGLGLLFVMLPIVLLSQTSAPAAIGDWLVQVLLKGIVGAVVFGAIAGHVAGRIFVWAKKKPDAEHQSMLTIGVALALTVLAAVKLFDSDGILAAFAAGITFNRLTDPLETHQQRMQGAISRFFDLPVFLLFGTLLPWAEWTKFGWQLWALALLILVLRRLPWWMLFKAFNRRLSRKEQMFSGWFGPIGVSAIYYCLLAVRETGLTWLWPVVSLLVVSSVLAHGISATPLAKRLRPQTEAIEADIEGR